jgi:hypothetical protein
MHVSQGTLFIAAAMAPPAAIFMALAALIAVVAAGPAELVCDGQLRTLEMATEPYPVSPPWTPWTGPPGITCRRTLPGTSQTCGSMASDKCQDIPFVPVVQASGAFFLHCMLLLGAGMHTAVQALHCPVATCTGLGVRPCNACSIG